MAVSITLSDSDFRDLVRDLMGDISSEIIPDDTIDEHKTRFAKPKLERKDISGSSDDIDTAVAAITAELAFKSWLKKQRIGGGGEALSVSIDVEEMLDNLEEQTEDALANLGIIEQNSDEPAPFVNSTNGMFEL